MRSFVFCLATWLVVSIPAHADLILSLGQGGSTAGIKNNFTAQAGGQLTLDVWVTQTGFFQPIPGFNFGDYRLSDNPGSTTQDGLSSYVYDATSNNAAVKAISATFGNGFLKDVALDGAQPADKMRVGGFAVTSQAQLTGGTATPLFVSETYASNFGVANTGSLANNSIRLGTVTYDVAANASGPVNIGVSSPYVDGNFFFFGIGSSLGLPAFAVAPTASFATLDVTPVPEPTGVLMVSALLGLGVRRLRPSLKFAKKHR